jgi:hypothetical protein
MSCLASEDEDVCLTCLEGLTLFAYLRSRTFLVNEQCFSLTINQRTVLSAMTFQPSEHGLCVQINFPKHIAVYLGD